MWSEISSMARFTVGVFVALFIALSINPAIQTFDRLGHKKTTGTVTDSKFNPTSTRYGRGAFLVNKIEVNYLVEGRDYNTSTTWPASTIRPNVGDKVAVYFNPANPMDASSGSYLMLWQSSIAILLLCLIIYSTILYFHRAVD